MPQTLIGSAHYTAAPVDEMTWLSKLSLGGLLTAMGLAVLGGLPFDLPMPTHAVGWVEPTCGLTRGSTALARGDAALAWRYNPMSFAAIGVGLAGLSRVIAGKLTGRWLTVRVRVKPAGWGLFILAVIGFWLYQQSNADFIITSRL